MLHRIKEALRIDFVLQYGRSIPRLINRLRMIIAKLAVVFHLNFPKDELPSGETAHGGNEPETGVKTLDYVAFSLAGKLPTLEAVVGDFGIKDEQLDQLFVAVVGVVIQGLATTVG